MGLEYYIAEHGFWSSWVLVLFCSREVRPEQQESQDSPPAPTFSFTASATLVGNKPASVPPHTLKTTWRGIPALSQSWSSTPRTDAGVGRGLQQVRLMANVPC